MASSASSEMPLLCHRCGRVLKPGSTGPGSFFVVRIEAFADPTPPSITGEESLEDIEREIDDLIDELIEHSQQELMDQIYRKMALTLCGSCYRTWIENPVG